MPPWGFAWREPFPFKRGDRVHAQCRPTTAPRPHVEDQQSSGLSGTGSSLAEDDLIECLKNAEVSQNLEHLFDCPVQPSPRGGHALCVIPQDAKRSICGCEFSNLRFRVFPEPGGFTLRAEIILSSNERVSSIPIVDREWQGFVGKLLQRIRRSDPLPLAERFLNWSVRNKLFAMPQRFARIGLPRPQGDQPCWLMLDSLFPQPQECWLDLL
jgi:hypothetical protein